LAGRIYGLGRRDNDSDLTNEEKTGWRQWTVNKISCRVKEMLKFTGYQNVKEIIINYWLAAIMLNELFAATKNLPQLITNSAI
jgi:hypothetical protein